MERILLWTCSIVLPYCSTDDLVVLFYFRWPRITCLIRPLDRRSPQHDRRREGHRDLQHHLSHHRHLLVGSAHSECRWLQTCFWRNPRCRAHCRHPPLVHRPRMGVPQVGLLDVKLLRLHLILRCFLRGTLCIGRVQQSTPICKCVSTVLNVANVNVKPGRHFAITMPFCHISCPFRLLQKSLSVSPLPFLLTVVFNSF